MKRLLMLFLCIGLIFCMYACKEPDVSDEKPDMVDEKPVIYLYPTEEMDVNPNLRDVKMSLIVK